jgi:hypothetical protein
MSAVRARTAGDAEVPAAEGAGGRRAAGQEVRVQWEKRGGRRWA